MATQNPIESEGTYPLPEAQVDRFMLKVVVGYPSPAEEVEVVDRSLAVPVPVERVLSVEALRGYQAAVRAVYVDRPVAEYAVVLAATTRDPASRGLDDLAPLIEFGASPRGSINLVHAARALALLRGRAYVLPHDVADLAHEVLRHRVVLTYEALASGVTADQVVSRVLEAVEAPRIDLAREAA
jgi:MoxR-like ATPase